MHSRQGDLQHSIGSEATCRASTRPGAPAGGARGRWVRNTSRTRVFFLPTSVSPFLSSMSEFLSFRIPAQSMLRDTHTHTPGSSTINLLRALKSLFYCTPLASQLFTDWNTCLIASNCSLSTQLKTIFSVWKSGLLQHELSFWHKHCRQLISLMLLVRGFVSIGQNRNNDINGHDCIIPGWSWCCRWCFFHNTSMKQ